MATDTALTLAESIVAHGFESLDAELDEFVTEARSAKANGTLLAVVADRSTPPAVRERAFGRVVVELSRDLPAPTLPAWVTSRVRRTVEGPVAA